MALLMSVHNIHFCGEINVYTIKIVIISHAFIRIIIFHKEGGGHLLEAAVFDNCKKSFIISKFSSDDPILILETEVYTSITKDILCID